MRVNYTLTREDFNAACDLHNRRNFSTRFQALFLIWFFPLLSVLYLILLIPKALVSMQFGTASLLLLIPVYFALSPVFRSLQRRQQFKALTSRSNECFFDADHERIMFGSPGLGETRLSWTLISDFVQDKRIMLVYIKKNFVFVPTRALSAADRNEFDELIARNLKKE